MPDCVTRWEGAVNAVGGPIAAAAMCAALAVALASHGARGLAQTDGARRGEV